MTPEERLMDEIKKRIPKGKHCDYDERHDCFYKHDRYCYLLNDHSLRLSKVTDYEFRAMKSSRCLELKPIKENNHE